VIIGCRGGAISELGGDPRAWKTVNKKSFFGWHDNCAYDSKNKVLVIFGMQRNSNDIVAYDPATKVTKKMPAKGTRPPKDQHNPMAFHPGIGQTVFVVDKTKKKDGAPKDCSETWCYDYKKDAWTRIETANLPFTCGMNYNMEYDTLHKVLLLVTGGYRAPTRVWALRPKLD
jgi:hypothetical protein